MSPEEPSVPEERNRLALRDIIEEQLGRAADAEGEADREQRVRRALLERPRFSIKARLTLLFSVLFLVTAGVGTAAWFALSRVEHSFAVVGITETFTQEVQEARRYEKNYLLYRSDLDQVVEHLDRAQRMLERAASEIRPVVGTGELKILRSELKSYRRLIDRLMYRRDDSEFHGSKEFDSIVRDLRDHGAEVLSRAFTINKAEHEQITAAVDTAKKAAVILFLIIFATCIYIGVHIYRHIVARLVRLMDAAKNVAAGDFSPILPKRRYQDEFSNLALAFNHMMHELERRQNIMVQSHKLRAVGNLTAGVAHELNNPLNNIVLTSEMLKEDWAKLSDDERVEMVDELTEQAERARTVVKNLLDFARETEAAVETIPVDKLIEEVLRLAQNQIKLSKIKLHIDVPGHLPPLSGDRNLLVQVFLNLILNAIDAMSPRGGHLMVRVTEEKEPGFLAFHIQDTGIGIPPHILQSIFDPFFTTKPTGKGTGLGLAVSQGIVNQHGGNIEVMSKPSAGTTFTVHLPCVPVPAAALGATPDLSRERERPPADPTTT